MGSFCAASPWSIPIARSDAKSAIAAKMRLRVGRGLILRAVSQRLLNPLDMILHPTSAASEKELEAKLDEPRVACRQDLPKRQVREVAIGRTEIRMVKQIEEFTAKFERRSFRKFRVLRKAEIHVTETILANRVPA